VPKVQHKPIKSPRKGSNKKSKRQPKTALVWRTGLSGVPPDSVRCTRVDSLQLASFGNFGSHSAKIDEHELENENFKFARSMLYSGRRPGIKDGIGFQ
jgi:hypothetical protein